MIDAVVAADGCLIRIKSKGHLLERFQEENISVSPLKDVKTSDSRLKQMSTSGCNSERVRVTFRYLAKI